MSHTDLALHASQPATDTRKRRQLGVCCWTIEKSRWKGKPKPVALILGAGNGNTKRSWSVCVTRHASLSQSAIMAAPNYEEAAAIATEFLSSASLVNAGPSRAD